MGLTPAQIAELMAKKKNSKGTYEDKLVFLYNESDEAGVDVAETWPMEFGGKPASTLYQGFSNAMKKLDMEDSVDVMNRDGHVFILVKSRVALVLAENPEPTADAADTNSNGNKAKDKATEVVADAVTEELV